MKNNPRFHFDNLFCNSPLRCGDYLVFQVGEMYCERDTEIPEHLQYCYEITYAVSGKGTVFTDQSSQPIQEGDGCLSLQTGSHRIQSDHQQPLRYKFLGFRPLPDTKGDQYLHILLQLFQKTGTTSLSLPSLNDHFLNIFREIRHLRAFSHDLIGCSVSQMLIELIRAHQHDTELPVSDVIPDESVLVYQISHYLDTRFDSIRNLSELESVFHYTYSRLSAVFQKQMKTTLHEYFQNLRLTKAKRLLEDPALSITAISERLHYSSIHTFSRSFKHRFGLSPLSYRQGILSDREPVPLFERKKINSPLFFHTAYDILICGRKKR